MEIATIHTGPEVLDSISEVTPRELERLKVNADELNARSMELTDAWGAMFVLHQDTVKVVAEALGCESSVRDKYYEAVRAIADVRQRTTASREGPREFTWHAFPGSLFVLRGFSDLSKAMMSIDDNYLRSFLDEHAALLDQVLEVQPQYAKDLLFSPDVAARVLAVFGATASADALLELGLQLGTSCAEDVEGRVGIASGLIRSIALVIAAEHTEHI